MLRYVILTRFTPTGIENVDESPERTADAIDLIESLSGRVRDFFVVMRRYDGVLVADFTDDETASLAVLALGRSGHATTETLRAFDLDEFTDVVARLGEVD